MQKLGLIVMALVAVFFLNAESKAQPKKVSDDTIATNAKSLLAETVSDAKGPGAVILIARDENVIVRSARGMADVELNVPLDPDQVFRIASITKIFTAAMIVKMAEDGYLTLDDPLSKYLPSFPNSDNVSLRQLLNHTGGISDQIPPSMIVPGFSRRDVDTTTLVTEIAKRQRVFAPGSDQSYSNSGYILLGAVIEKILGKPWDIAIGERLIAPLKMNRTEHGIASKIVAGRVNGYTTDNNKLVSNAPFFSMTMPGAAGALISTADACEYG